ncbi:hypothetical protein [Sphingobium sp. CAP-1]|uniref:hypothetical protein n=1 Tax=Sphingobium sp. CAP-1 TaxID=2676077 RepID=UPI0012BB320B|nr:hypothetical protein [Sphingobium sp. CAP-1]QGP78817.1 hypothetical protein GL174_07295 [Sphingobium sp. CAP-1]
MFALIAATLFSAAFLLAVGTITWMFAHYHDKMVAALRFEPIPQHPPVYHLRVRRPRVTPRTRAVAQTLPTGALAA